jgi:hypothetical protein
MREIDFERNIKRDAIDAIDETDKIKRDDPKHPKQPLSPTERARAAGYTTYMYDNFLADEAQPASPNTPPDEILPSHLLQEINDDGNPVVPPPIRFDPRVFLPKKKP